MSLVLVADDAPALRVLLRRCLEMGGHDTVTASDGTEAIRLLRAPGASFDAVVTDHAMPGASGLEVIAAAHLVDPRLPCIIVTAHVDLDLATAALQAGADAFVPKPFKPEHLLTILDRALEHRRRDASIEVSGSVEAYRAGDAEWSGGVAARTAGRLGLDAADVARARMAAAMRTASHTALPMAATALLTHHPGAADRLEHNRVLAAAALLDGIAEFDDVRLAVLHQAERWDGAGHPDGLAGEQIPLLARIVAAVEVAAAAPTTLASATSALRDQTGAALDPRVVTELIAVLAEDATTGELTGRRPPTTTDRRLAPA